MKKKWKITLECPGEDMADAKIIYVDAIDETEAFTKVGNMPDHKMHCPHGVLRIIDINTEK